MKVSVHYTDYPSTSLATQPFTVRLEDDCNASVAVTPPTQPPNQSYNVGDVQLDLVYEQFTWTPTYCRMFTQWDVVDPPPNDGGTFSHNSGLRTVSTYTLDNDTAGRTYTILLWLKTEGGTDINCGGCNTQFAITINSSLDPCYSATVDPGTQTSPLDPYEYID